jgi:hypothetical protein
MGHSRTKVEYEAKAEKPKNAFSVEIRLVKNEGENLDVKIDFINTSQETIRLNRKSFELTFNGQNGKQRGYFDETLEPNQTKSKDFYFEFSPKLEEKGAITLKVSPINTKNVAPATQTVQYNAQ